MCLLKIPNPKQNFSYSIENVKSLNPLNKSTFDFVKTAREYWNTQSLAKKTIWILSVPVTLGLSCLFFRESVHVYYLNKKPDGNQEVLENQGEQIFAYLDSNQKDNKTQPTEKKGGIKDFERSGPGNPGFETVRPASRGKYCNDNKKHSPCPHKKKVEDAIKNIENIEKNKKYTDDLIREIGFA